MVRKEQHTCHARAGRRLLLLACPLQNPNQGLDGEGTALLYSPAVRFIITNVRLPQ